MNQEEASFTPFQQLKQPFLAPMQHQNMLSFYLVQHAALPSQSHNIGVPMFANFLACLTNSFLCFVSPFSHITLNNKPFSRDAL